MDSRNQKGISYIIGKNNKLVVYNQDEAFRLELRTKSIEELEAMLYEDEKKEKYERCAILRDEINSRIAALEYKKN